jgi:transcriptional regulator with XRE-family HTH domain
MSPIYKYRIEHGLTIAELAERLKVGTSTACRWENHPDRIPDIKVNRIAKALSIKPQELRPDL